MGISIGTGITIEQGVSITVPPPSGSAQLVTTSSYLTTTVDAPGTTASTYECWFYTSSLPSGDNVLFNTALNGNGSTGILLSLINGTYAVVRIGAFLLNTGVSVTLDAWNHVAITIATGASTNSGTLFVNGSSLGTFTPPTLSSTDLYIGGRIFVGMTGYISNFRYVRGVRVYTGTFTPPTAPLSAIQNAGVNISAITAGQTQLLLNTPYSAGFLADSSSYSRTVSSVGTVTTAQLNPFS